MIIILMLLFFTLFSSTCLAQIDVTGATTGITDGMAAVTAVLGALTAAYGVFVGYRLVVGSLYGFTVDELGEAVEIDDEELFYRNQDIIDAYWESSESSGVGNLDFYEWAEKYGIPVDDIDPSQVY